MTITLSRQIIVRVIVILETEDDTIRSRDGHVTHVTSCYPCNVSVMHYARCARMAGVILLLWARSMSP